MEREIKLEIEELEELIAPASLGSPPGFAFGGGGGATGIIPTGGPGRNPKNVFFVFCSEILRVLG